VKRSSLGLCLALALVAVGVLADVRLETGAFVLEIGDNAAVKSLRVKSNGEECVANGDALPIFSVTQDRPFNNEIKLNYPNKRTTYPANRIRREGDVLVVGFELAPYEALVKVHTRPAYVVFELQGFKVLPGGYGDYLEMDTPPVAEFRIAQLPVRRRRNFGEWVNAAWDERSAVAVMSVEPLVDVDHETRGGHPVLTADLRRGFQLRGGKAAVVAADGEKGFLDAVDALEADYDLPRGVRSRRSGRLNESIYWTHDLTPESVDEEIAWAKKGGFRMMLVYYPSFLNGGLSYSRLGDYDWNEKYPNGAEDLKKVVAKVKSAGITPGLHVLQTHIGLKSRYVTPVADARLNKTRWFSLAREISAEGEPGEIFVNESPVDCVLRPKCRILQFGGELFTYEGYETRRPYRFTGVRRGACSTRAAHHPKGERGGVLDVSEFGATSCYIDQNTDLQDEVAEKIARIYDCGFEFIYCDGSEGVNTPCGVNVSYAQYRTISKFAKPPLFSEGAAKSHFGWHIQSGANAFDVFKPEVFKEKIAEFPLAEALVMRQNFTRLDFGWWGMFLPGSKPDGVATVGTQADMWEYGTSKAAAWDCPAALQTVRTDLARHPRINDLMETMRRWEDVRARKWLTAEQRRMLRDPKREFHLYRAESGDYELHEIEMLAPPKAAEGVRAFVFSRGGKRVVAYWHVSGSGRWKIPLDGSGRSVTLEAGDRRYWETGLSIAEVKNAVARSELEGAPAAEDSGVLFRATFDGYSTTADVGKSKTTLKGSIPQELQLRMHPDVSSTSSSKNALTLTTPEYVAWPLAGNFSPSRGTVSFWMKPMNYTLASDKYYRVFFEALGPDYEFYVYQGKYYAKTVTFWMRSGAEVNSTSAKVDWKPEDWHHVAVTWDPGSMSLYLDGQLAVGKRRGGAGAGREIDPPVALPKSLASGIIALNYSQGWSNLDKDTLTAYDELEIRDVKLTAREIHAAFAKARPDLAAAAGAAQATAAMPEPARLTYICLPGEKALNVRLDISAVDIAKKTDVPVRLSIVERSGKRVVVKKDAVFATSDSEVALCFGDRLKEGEAYDVVAEIEGVPQRSSAPFRMPDCSFLRSRVAVDDTVPAPWTPVRREGPGVFSVLERVYTFSEGPFPSQIVCRGENLLVDPPALKTGGAKVRWTKPTLVETHPDRVVLKSTGRIGELAFEATSELWFDGLVKIDFDMKPSGGQPAKIPSLELGWSVPRAVARYLLLPEFAPWKGDSFSCRYGSGRNDNSLLWTTGVFRGLAWWTASDANWVRTKDGDDIRIVRNAKVADVTVEMIKGPVDLVRPAHFQMAFQGTPAKPTSRDYRVCRNPRDMSTCGWTSHSGRKASDNTLHWTSFVPSRPKDYSGYLEAYAAKGCSMLAYGMPAHISPLDEPWDYFYGQSRKRPGIRWDYVDEFTHKPSRVMPCCGHTPVADWHVANIERLFKTQPQLKGLYFDISSVGPCDNTLHGDGGIDAFGRSYFTSNALHMREYFLRVLKLCRRHGRRLSLHAHNLYFPFVHSWADECWPGEEQYQGYLNNPRYHYLEGISEEAYQSAWSPEIRGMGVRLIPQNSRASELAPERTAKDPEAFTGSDAVYGTFLPSLVYDFDCLGLIFDKGRQTVDRIWAALDPLKMDKAVFHGYWFDPAVRSAKGIRSALYTWGRGEGPVPFLLVVGNFSREDVATEAKLDWKKLGVAPCRLEDRLTKKTFSEGELAAYSLRSHNFLLLVPADLMKRKQQMKGTCK